MGSGIISLSFQLSSTMFAKDSLLFMSASPTVRTFQGLSASMFFHHRRRYNACGNSNDSIPHQHHHSRKKTPQRSFGSNIAISHSSHGDYRPINAVRNIIESCAGTLSFNHIHQRSDRNNQYQHKEKKNDNLATAIGQ